VKLGNPPSWWFTAVDLLGDFRILAGHAIACRFQSSSKKAPAGVAPPGAESRTPAGGARASWWRPPAAPPPAGGTRHLGSTRETKEFIMPVSIEQILQEALSRPAVERAAIAESLLSSLDRPDPAIDALWAVEAESRLAAFDAGQMEAIPAEDVFAEFDQP